jgi:hypothetical protein
LAANTDRECAGGPRRVVALAGVEFCSGGSDLRNRAPAADTESLDEADEIGRRTVLDVDADDAAEIADVSPARQRGAEGGTPPSDAGYSIWPAKRNSCREILISSC